MNPGIIDVLLRRDTGGDDTGGGGGVELPRDDAYGVLSNQRRRAVTRYLLDHDGAVALGELAEAVSAWEHGVERSALTGDQRQRLYVPLHQTHLPKMEDARLVEYDRSRKVVRPGAALPAVRGLVGPSLREEAPPLAAK